MSLVHSAPDLAGAATGATVGRFYFTPSSSIFSPAIVDILDYADTNKYTTVRSLGGTDVNPEIKTHKVFVTSQTYKSYGDVPVIFVIVISFIILH